MSPGTQPAPWRWYGAVHVKSHWSPAHVAVAWGGVGQGIVGMPPSSGAQLPAPSQNVAAFSIAGGPKHACAPHGLDAPGNVQSGATPSQLAAQLSKTATGHDLKPGGLPATVVQLPPAMLHAWHVPLHAESQQTPSAQWPESQSPSRTHDPPSCRERPAKGESFFQQALSGAQ